MLNLAAYRRLEIFDMPFPVNRLVRNPSEETRTAVNTVINAGKVGVAGHFRPFLDAPIGGITINDLVGEGCLNQRFPISNMKQKINSDLEIADILITMADLRTNYSREIIELLV